VEDSLEHILQAYGCEQIEVFAIPACIIINIVENGVNHSKTVRIKGSGNNMFRLGALNDLSRKICREIPSIQTAQAELEEILQSPLYPDIISFIGYGAGAAFFTLFWGGKSLDAIIAFCGGLIIKPTLSYMKEVKANIFFTNLLASMLSAIFPVLLQSIGVPMHLDKIIIGDIMLLVPGIAMTNVFRDVLSGDFVTAVSKLAEVLIVSLAIAVGIILPISATKLILTAIG
jgi:uncharacterized membrane protein YjjP (DUF1212 family)